MNRTLPKFYTEAEMARLVLAPDLNSKTGARDRAILSLLCATGLRVSELCELRYCDWWGDKLLVNRGKAGTQRWVPVSLAAQQAIRAYLVVVPIKRIGHPLFRSTASGRGLTRRHLHKLVTGYSRQLRLRGGVHTLRNSAATRWLNRGLGLHTVRAILGHAHLQTTGRYLGVATQAVVAEYQAKVEGR